MFRAFSPGRTDIALALGLAIACSTTRATEEPRAGVHLEEATIAQIQQALQARLAPLPGKP